MVGLLDDHLLAAACRAGVAHLFCGHSHQPRRYPLPSNPAVQVYGAGTAIHYGGLPPNANSLHPREIDGDGGTIPALHWTTWRWDAGRKDFVKEGRWG